MKKYQKSSQKILSSIIHKKYLVHNGKIFVFVKVRSSIVGYFFGCFVKIKKLLNITQKIRPFSFYLIAVGSS